MPRSVPELQARIAELEGELAGLRRGAGFTLAPGGVGATGLVSSLGARATLVGVEEMIATVGQDGRLAYLNGEMARFLGGDRKELNGRPLAELDRTALGEGFLSGLVEGARSAREPWIVERECPGLELERLPGSEGRRRPQTAPILRLVASARGDSVTVVVQDITEIKWLERNFARCVSPEVLLRMYQTAEADFFTPERREITVLFGDLRGFTRLSNELPPEEVHSTVNSFLAQMVAAVEAYTGTVDKFVGDEVMALFGAPLPQDDHALRGLLCAVEMQRRQAVWNERRVADGKPPLGLGVGIATGPVVVGNVGTAQRLEYTAIGHTVNLGARLCGEARPGEILTIGRTYDASHEAIRSKATQLARIPHLRFESAGRRQLKNLLVPVDVIGVTCAE